MDDWQEQKLLKEKEIIEYMLSNLYSIKDNIDNTIVNIHNTNKEITSLKKNKTMEAYRVSREKPNIKHFTKDIIIICIVFSLMFININIDTSLFTDSYKMLNNFVTLLLGCITVLFVSNLKDDINEEKIKYDKLLEKIKEYDTDINSKKKDLNKLTEDLNHYMNTYKYINSNINNLNIRLNDINTLLDSNYLSNVDEIKLIRKKDEDIG